MIRKWGVEKFRSIHKAKLDLAPLTIFTGVNNSGKSAFIESMAFMAQSLRGNKKSIELNGDLVELGNFEENYSNNDPEKSNTIDIYFESEKHPYVDDEYYPSCYYECGYYNKNDIYSFQDPKDEPSKAPSYPTRYEKIKHNYDWNDCGEGKIEESIVEIPIYDVPDFFSVSLEEQRSSDRNNPASLRVAKIELEARDGNDPYYEEDYDHISYDEHIFTSEERLGIINEFLGIYFSPENFRYLGLFRSPDPSKQKSYGEDEYVNSDGNNTFAVLNKFIKKEDSNVLYCLPDVLENKEYNGKKRYTLIHTIDCWLKHFELGDTCRVLNGEILFNIDGREYTLRQLGSGVSQILPIWVMCLTAPPNSTIIIEEPEAHFHPKVQARLADFFIAIALTGRQCIIETHSEYLIEQLRYRIVKTKQDILKKTKLYFAAKQDGISHFRDIEINEYAALDDWPEDFFDESHKISNEIMKEVVRKWETTKQND